MTKELAQFADAFKTAGDALMKLGELFEEYTTEKNVIPLEHSSSKRKRSAKDLNAPKKNLSSYFQFCGEVRPQLTKEHPTLTMLEISKLMGEKWNSLGAKDKKPYQEAANKDKIRYDKEMAIYKTSDTNDLSKVAKKAKSRSTKPTADDAPAPAATPESSVTTAMAPDEITGTTEMASDKQVPDEANGIIETSCGEEVFGETAPGEREKEKKRKKKNKKSHKNKH